MNQEFFSKLWSHGLEAFRLSQEHQWKLPFNPWRVGGLFVEASARIWDDPSQLLKSQQSYLRHHMALWYDSAARFWQEQTESHEKDRRFKEKVWQDHPYFYFLYQAYLYHCRWLLDQIAQAENLDPAVKKQIIFYVKQFLDALSPSNFPLTNPQVLSQIFSTKGENLLKGMENFLEDLERGKGHLTMKMTPLSAFTLGKDLACTPGKVIFENDLMQLIRYAPSTENVYEYPILIIPPWINKYYVFDLRPENSFVKWLRDQGHTVFIISWVNPTAALAHKTFEDYMLEGGVAALEAIEKETGAEAINVMGYCLGGNLLSCLLSYVEQTKKHKIKSATFLAVILDFKDAGDLSVFMDEAQVRELEDHMAEKGYLDGRVLSSTFSLLRANDLVWTFFVNNYLLGSEPFPLDFLFWNGDFTHMPAAMHRYFLREIFQKNRLIQPKGLHLGGCDINLHTLKTPCFFLSTKDDHIAPWRCAYVGTQILKGPVTFVLAGSGHVAGIINPPSSKKYSYWQSDTYCPSADVWASQAKETKGSWWTAWQKWAAGHGGKLIPSAYSESGSIEKAPGRYVYVKAH